MKPLKPATILVLGPFFIFIAAAVPTVALSDSHSTFMAVLMGSVLALYLLPFFGFAAWISAKPPEYEMSFLDHPPRRIFVWATCTMLGVTPFFVAVGWFFQPDVALVLFIFVFSTIGLLSMMNGYVLWRTKPSSRAGCNLIGYGALMGAISSSTMPIADAVFHLGK